MVVGTGSEIHPAASPKRFRCGRDCGARQGRAWRRAACHLDRDPRCARRGRETRMSLLFEELDHRETPIGALSLRRRRELTLGIDVFEIKLGEEFLMSSLFTASEIALARLGLAELSGADVDVVVAGLGLGYTARAVLEHRKVASLIVVEALDAVIDWHEKGVLPLGPALTVDPRSRFVLGDFFARAASKDGF